MKFFKDRKIMFYLFLSCNISVVFLFAFCSEQENCKTLDTEKKIFYNDFLRLQVVYSNGRIPPVQGLTELTEARQKYTNLLTIDDCLTNNFCSGERKLQVLKLISVSYDKNKVLDLFCCENEFGNRYFVTEYSNKPKFSEKQHEDLWNNFCTIVAHCNEIRKNIATMIEQAQKHATKGGSLDHKFIYREKDVWEKMLNILCSNEGIDSCISLCVKEILSNKGKMTFELNSFGNNVQLAKKIEIRDSYGSTVYEVKDKKIVAESCV